MASSSRLLPSAPVLPAVPDLVAAMVSPESSSLASPVAAADGLTPGVPCAGGLLLGGSWCCGAIVAAGVVLGVSKAESEAVAVGAASGPCAKMVGLAAWRQQQGCDQAREL